MNDPSRTVRRRAVRAAVAGLAAGALAACSFAQSSAPAPAPSSTAASTLTSQQLLALVQASVDQAAAAVLEQHPGVRIQTQVGGFNPQLKLAPCQVAQPYLNPGPKAWGEIRIGLRCTVGAVRWNVHVPAVVRVYGPAWVAGSNLPTGHLLTETDLVKQEAEWSAETGGLVSSPDQWIGRTVAGGLRAGQAVRAQHLRARQWFTAGQTVTLVARGAGFAVSSEGVAITPGLEGQATQVRLENGRIVQGTAVGARRVEVTL